MLVYFTPHALLNIELPKQQTTAGESEENAHSNFDDSARMENNGNVTKPGYTVVESGFESDRPSASDLYQMSRQNNSPQSDSAHNLVSLEQDSNGKQIEDIFSIPNSKGASSNRHNSGSDDRQNKSNPGALSALADEQWKPIKVDTETVGPMMKRTYVKMQETLNHENAPRKPLNRRETNSYNK